MKLKFKVLQAALLVTLVAVIAFGCTTASQTTAYKTISTVEQTATTAVSGYYALVINGTVPTNDVPRVSAIYNDIQAAGLLAAAASQAGTNALAPETLVVELTDLTTLITTITHTK